MGDNIFTWTLRAVRRWPATALTLGMAAATAVFAYAVNQGGPAVPRTSHDVAAVAAASTPMPSPPAPAPAPLPSLHPTCAFRINAIPAGSVYLATWGGPTCPRLAELLQKAEDRQLQGTPASVIVSLSTIDPTTSGPPVCTHGFGTVMTWRVYATSSGDGVFARQFCEGLKLSVGGGQKSA
jgi:hypothetical protein